jgi:hypothetical protein
LPLKLVGQRLINLTMTVGLWIVPEPVVAMPVILPAGMIEDGIKTNALDGYSGREGCTHLAGDISQPFRPTLVFCPGFRNEQGTLITLVNLG